MNDRTRARTGPTAPGGDEFVVLLDDLGRPCGSALKADVHHQHTPLHLAFSCWVTDPDDRILITRRAWSKKTWPGVWTNAFCGHPHPGEAVPSAVHRRAGHELGVSITEPRPALPDFRYRAVMPNGLVENEICPVFVAELLSDPAPAPEEVAEFRWMTARELHRRIDLDEHWFSPWATRQLSELAQGLTVFRGAPLSGRSV